MTSSALLRLLPALVACAVVPGCRHKPTDMPVCTEYVTAEHADEADTRALPPEVWFELLVMGIHRPELTVPDEPRECSGKAVECGPIGPPDPMSPRRLPRARAHRGRPDLREGPDGQMIVWARLDHFDDGTARGPVALVRWVDRGVQVRGIGTLWAPQRRARAAHRAARREDALLIADGERCTAATTRARAPTRSTCSR
jgi:hypothetical protein